MHSTSKLVCPNNLDVLRKLRMHICSLIRPLTHFFEIKTQHKISVQPAFGTWGLGHKYLPSCPEMRWWPLCQLEWFSPSVQTQTCCGWRCAVAQRRKSEKKSTFLVKLPYNINTQQTFPSLVATWCFVTWWLPTSLVVKCRLLLLVCLTADPVWNDLFSSCSLLFTCIVTLCEVRWGLICWADSRLMLCCAVRSGSRGSCGSL